MSRLSTIDREWRDAVARAMRDAVESWRYDGADPRKFDEVHADAAIAFMSKRGAS